MKKNYQQQILEAEHGSFISSVFSATGGMGPVACAIYGRLASLLAETRSMLYHGHQLALLPAKCLFAEIHSHVCTLANETISHCTV